MAEDEMANSVLANITLEHRCNVCEGTGGEPEAMHPEDRWRCSECSGSGYILTQFGQKILSLMQHRFRSMLDDHRAKNDCVQNIRLL